MTASGIEPTTFRFVAQHLNHCATAVPPVLCKRTRNWHSIQLFAILGAFLSPCTKTPHSDMASSFTRFLDHTQRLATVGRIPLDE